MSAPDVLLVSLGSTAGLRAADEVFAAQLRSSGAAVEIARAAPCPQVRTMALTDYRWARSAAAAARAAIASKMPRTIVYSSTTAAMFWPKPGAIRFDAAAAENRPGRDGIWQRPLERRRFAESRLLIPWSEAALTQAPQSAAATVVVPPPVDPSGPPVADEDRDIAAITYAADPQKKGLGAVLEAWAQARRGDERLVVAGLDPARLPSPGPGVEVVGLLPSEQYRALLRRSKLFVCAPRREDFGLAQLEALADGCQLATTAAPGAYEALRLARELDPNLVGDDLAASIRKALDAPGGRYRERAARLMEPFASGSVQQTISAELMAQLLP
ncbi:MAG: glycosyltransferase [Actinobacteria bacterium]|uniref:Unannotated protein n=1 Tax=freshwater metagenome TaxID=449393 RepID=A0A6J5ZEK3_9ZZZZ|nr:glycosyltransferase [Actinomycetota bacterium]